MLVNGEIKSCLTSFKILVLIPSGPLLFLVDISLIILPMTDSETKGNLKRELVELSKIVRHIGVVLAVISNTD